jgi:ABC-2 type transport system ATP-binding protein
MALEKNGSEVLLSLKNVSKTYFIHNFATIMKLRLPQQSVALRGVSFELRAGEITALLGPNGAGKTTLATIIADLTRADSGQVTVAGLPVPERSREAQQHIGYLTTNDRSFFWRLNGRMNLEFFAALHGFRQAEARQRTAEMLDRFKLTSQADRPFHTYSTGMKKRLGLARAFLHDPKVLLLDEPTNGLDAQSTEELLELVRHQIQRTGKTVLWATHRAEEVEKLCDRVIVLIAGEKRFDGTSEIFQDISRRHMRFSMELLPPAGDDCRFFELIRVLELTVATAKADGKLRVSGAGDERQLSSVLAALLDNGAFTHRV